MNTVIIDKPDLELQTQNSGIRVATQHIPFQLIDMLILSADITLNTKTLLQLSKHNIPVLAIAKDNRLFSLTLPLSTKNSMQKFEQYSSLEKRVGFAKYFLGEKFKSHHQHLVALGHDVTLEPWLQKVEQTDDIEVLMGIEGAYSKLYFSYYFKTLPKLLHKSKRTKRPPEDPVNAMLSYLYTLVYHLLSAKLYMAGFDPALSYLHTPFRGHNGLSSDFLELYRAEINIFVMALFLDEILSTEDFRRKEGVYLRYESRKKIWFPIKTFISTLSQKIDQEIALFRATISS